MLPGAAESAPEDVELRASETMQQPDVSTSYTVSEAIDAVGKPFVSANQSLSKAGPPYSVETVGMLQKAAVARSQHA